MNLKSTNFAAARAFASVAIAILLLFCIPARSAGATPPPNNTAAVHGIYDDQPLSRPGTVPDRAGQSILPTADSNRTATGLDIPRVCYSLAIVIGLVLVLRWGARRFLPGAATPRATSAVRLLARTPIGPKQQILLVSVGRRVLVIGDTGQQMTSLADISDPAEVAALTAHLTNAHASVQIEQDQAEAESAFAQELATAGQRTRPAVPPAPTATTPTVAAKMAQRLMSRLASSNTRGRAAIAPQPAVPPMSEPQPDVSADPLVHEPADSADQSHLSEITERVRKLSRHFERS